MSFVSQKPDIDPIAALGALNAAHARVDEASKAIQEYADAKANADKIQKDFDELVNYLRAHAPEGTYWWSLYGGT